MKTGARFHVMRYAPLIGRPGTAKRVTVAYHAYSLREALDVARGRLPELVWIQHRDGTAHTHRRGPR